MAKIRLITSALIGSCMLLLLPGAVSAQSRVHEVRPAGADEVRIGVDGVASMEDIASLARRVSGNAEINVDDVIANLPHARRYACYAEGRQVYFGTDPAYRGRCPEDATRRDGVLRGATYHVPRVHGAILTQHVTRHASRDTRHAELTESEVTVEETDTRVEELMAANAELETRVATLTTERDEAQVLASATAADFATAEETLNAASDANRRLERERNEARASVQSARRTWYLAIPAVLLLISLFLFLLWFTRHRSLKSQSANRARLEAEKKTLTTKVEGLEMENKALKGDLDKEINRNVKTRIRLKRAMVSFIRLLKRLDDTKNDLESYASRFTPFQVRKERIEHNHAKLAELRELEDSYDVHVVQIDSAQAKRAEAEAAGDTKTVEHCDAVIEILREQIAKLPFDPEALKTQIEYLARQLVEDMHAQCGIEFDTRPALELKVEYEARLREEHREVEAQRRNYQAMCVQVANKRLADKLETENIRRTLEADFAKKDGELEARAWEMASFKHEADEDRKHNLKTILKLREQVQAREDEKRELQEKVEELDRLAAMLVGNDPSAHAKAILAREARIADLELKLKEVGIDPGSGPKMIRELLASPVPEPMNGSGSGAPAAGLERPRIPTVTLGAGSDGQGRMSGLPSPPASPSNAINMALYRFLETCEGMPSDGRIIECSERAARDWAFFFGQWSFSVTAPWNGPDEPKSAREVPVRRFPETVKKNFPDWLKDRLRRRTDPPPAPSVT